MVCNRFVYHVHEDVTTFASAFLLRPTSSYHVLTAFSFHPVLTTFLLSFKTSTSTKISLRPLLRSYHVLQDQLRPYGVLKFLGPSTDVVRTWPSVDVTLNALLNLLNRFKDFHKTQFVFTCIT